MAAEAHADDPGDLAVLFRYAMRNALFREIVQTKISSVNSKSIVRKKTVARRISVRNHNRLLWNFNGAIGGKTGYTHAAQKCFVGAVARNRNLENRTRGRAAGLRSLRMSDAAQCASTARSSGIGSWYGRGAGAWTAG